MRKDFLNIIAKLSRKCHLQNAMYAVCKAMLPVRVNYDIDAEAYLHTISPRKENSCLCENTIDAHPQYDLEIIIPVYNAEAYIEHCADSIVNQKTRYKYRAVFVNDGSTDNSRSILENYAHYANVSIIDTPNRGVSAARNLPLQDIHARYVMFVDADDYLTMDAVEKLVSKADETQASVVEGNHQYFRGNKMLSVSKNTDEEGNEVLIKQFPWGKVYKADLWQHISFPLDYRYEDMVCALVLCPIPVKKATISDVIYYYRDTPTGFTRAYNSDKRRVEAYWVTRQLLQDAQQLTIPSSVFFYEIFLRISVRNTTRVAILGDRKADYALFEAHRHLRETYFKDLRAQGEKEKRIESALLNDDFKEYLLYSLFLY